MDGRIIFGQWMKNLRIGFYQNLLLSFFLGGRGIQQKSANTERLSSNWAGFESSSIKGFECCDNWKLIDCERLDFT